MSEGAKLKSDPLAIYAKDGVIRCLTLKQSGAEPLIENEWKLTAIIDPAEWIEALANKGIAREAILQLKGASSKDIEAISLRRERVRELETP